MNWYENVTFAMMEQARVEKDSREYWKFMTTLKPKRIGSQSEINDGLYGKAVHVLQEMLDSDNAELRLQAAEIVIKHSKNRSKISLIS
jgi:hypothetical protein